VVGAGPDADDDVSAEEHHARNREVDPGVHDHEHLSQRGDSEDRHVGEDKRPRRALECVRRDDPSHDDECRGRDPDREESGTDQGGSDER
jgi:hypothetical protein